MKLFFSLTAAVVLSGCTGDPAFDQSFADSFILGTMLGAGGSYTNSNGMFFEPTIGQTYLGGYPAGGYVGGRTTSYCDGSQPGSCAMR